MGKREGRGVTWPSHDITGMLTGPDGQLTEGWWKAPSKRRGVVSLAGLTMSLLMEGVWCLCLERDTSPPLMTMEAKGLNTHSCCSNMVHTCRVIHSCKLFIVVSIEVLVLWISCVDGPTETEKDICSKQLTCWVYWGPVLTHS